MKILKTLAVAGLLTVGSTAADASTFGWGNWSWSSNSNSYSNPVSSNQSFSRIRSFNVSSLSRGNGTQIRTYVLNRVRQQHAVPTRPSTPTPTSDVPLPAGGLLLVGAMGALALGRRKKT